MPAVGCGVVFALGTNGGITDTQVKEALAILGPSRRLVLVTPHHGDDPNSPPLVRAEVTRYAPQTVLLDWDRLSSPHPEWFASDGVHLGGSAGQASGGSFLPVWLIVVIAVLILAGGGYALMAYRRQSGSPAAGHE